MHFITVPLVAAAFTLISRGSAQVYTKCDPTNVTCPPSRGLSSDFYSIDFTTIDSQPNEWKLANYEYVTYNTQGRHNGAEMEFLKRYDSPYMETDFYFFFGRIEFVVQAAPGPGIISCMVLLSDDLDEVDWEFRGTLDTVVQTGWFGKGVTGLYNHSITPTIPTPMTKFHTYALDWSPEQLVWEADGVPIRTLKASDCVGTNNWYPQTPMKVSLSLWDAGDPGHYDPWSAGMTPIPPPLGGFSMYAKSVKIWNANPASWYNWTDHSGTWQSIQLINDTLPSSVTSINATVAPTSINLNPINSTNPYIATSSSALGINNFLKGTMSSTASLDSATPSSSLRITPAMSSTVSSRMSSDGPASSDSSSTHSIESSMIISSMTSDATTSMPSSLPTVRDITSISLPDLSATIEPTSVSKTLLSSNTTTSALLRSSATDMQSGNMKSQLTLDLAGLSSTGLSNASGGNVQSTTILSMASSDSPSESSLSSGVSTTAPSVPSGIPASSPLSLSVLTSVEVGKPMSTTVLQVASTLLSSNVFISTNVASATQSKTSNPRASSSTEHALPAGFLSASSISLISENYREITSARAISSLSVSANTVIVSFQTSFISPDPDRTSLGFPSGTQIHASNAKGSIVPPQYSPVSIANQAPSSQVTVLVTTQTSNSTFEGSVSCSTCTTGRPPNGLPNDLTLARGVQQRPQSSSFTVSLEGGASVNSSTNSLVTYFPPAKISSSTAAQSISLDLSATDHMTTPISGMMTSLAGERSTSAIITTIPLSATSGILGSISGYSSMTMSTKCPTATNHTKIANESSFKVSNPLPSMILSSSPAVSPTIAPMLISPAHTATRENETLDLMTTAFSPAEYLHRTTSPIFSAAPAADRQLSSQLVIAMPGTVTPGGTTFTRNATASSMLPFSSLKTAVNSSNFTIAASVYTSEGEKLTRTPVAIIQADMSLSLSRPSSASASLTESAVSTKAGTELTVSSQHAQGATVASIAYAGDNLAANPKSVTTGSIGAGSNTIAIGPPELAASAMAVSNQSGKDTTSLPQTSGSASATRDITSAPSAPFPTAVVANPTYSVSSPSPKGSGETKSSRRTFTSTSYTTSTHTLTSTSASNPDDFISQSTGTIFEAGLPSSDVAGSLGSTLATGETATTPENSMGTGSATDLRSSKPADAAMAATRVVSSVVLQTATAAASRMKIVDILFVLLLFLSVLKAF